MNMRQHFYRTAEFGPIMNAYAWLEKRSFSLQGLFDKLKIEDGGYSRTAIVIKRKDQLIAVLTCGTYESAVESYGPMIDGKHRTYYIDTGMGHRFPSDRIEVVDVVGVNVEGQLTSFKGSALTQKVTPYVFK